MDIAQLQIRVRTEAPGNDVSSFKDSILNLRVNRPPYRGKANDSIIF